MKYIERMAPDRTIAGEKDGRYLINKPLVNQ